MGGLFHCWFVCAALLYSSTMRVAVRTGGAGMGGLSLLLVERTMPGVKTRCVWCFFSVFILFRRINCSGVWSSGTAYVIFEDVVVPKTNLIGKENNGFKVGGGSAGIFSFSASFLPLTSVHHVQLQSRAHGHRNSSLAFCSRLLRRIFKICAQAKDIRQTTCGPPCDPPQAC